MCGIAGFANLSNNFQNREIQSRNIIDKMKDALGHRGPDDRGTYLGKHAVLGHTRLSIIDLLTGHLPLTRMFRGARFTITYNGEIYNMKPLKNELIKLGYDFITGSDAEVALIAYIAYKEEFITKLNGIFSFAIYDEEKESLLLFRDQLGVKPCFYVYQNDTLYFASEIKALFAHPDIHPVLDSKGLTKLLALGPARPCGDGIFQNVLEILPGHYLEFNKSGLFDHCYWTLKAKKHKDSYKETVEKVRFLLEDSVKLQLLSDVPISTFLSGGVDSSIVTAIAARELKKEGTPLSTYSFDFTDNQKYYQQNAFQPSLDRPFVDIMVNEYHTNHTYLECDYTSLFDHLVPATLARDFPCMADVEASLLYFCRLVSQNHKVTLTGECADEIFGGYPWFLRYQTEEFDNFPWSNDMSSRTLLLNNDLAQLPLLECSKEHYQNTLSEAPICEEDLENNKIRQISYLNMRWFMITLLERMDRTSMNSGLEARVPFADYRIVEYLYNIPWEMKAHNGKEKGLLRDAFSDLLPEQILNRKKSPYPKTYHPAYEMRLKEELLNLIKDSSQPINQILDRKKVLKVMGTDLDYCHPWYGQLMAGPQLLAYYIQMNAWLKVINPTFV